LSDARGWADGETVALDPPASALGLPPRLLRLGFHGPVPPGGGNAAGACRPRRSLEADFDEE
jgi:hypothetical protein